MAATNLALLLRGDPPILLDEWQTAPELWNAVRHEVDDRQARGQFILTGSSRPLDDAQRHSGAGRMAKVRMRTLSLWEGQRSTGEVSLAEIFSGRAVEGMSKIPFIGYAEHVVHGGWPAILDASIDEAIAFSEDYVDLIVEHDAASLDGVRRDPTRLRRFLEAYAALSAHPVSMSRIVARATAKGDTLARVTADGYAVAVDRLMVTDDVRAWSTHLRSRARLATVPKRHLADPSLACALLRLTPERLLDDLKTFGFLFESLVARDLRVYAQANDADVYHYREHGGDLEVDLIVEARSGAWIGVEVKLGEGYIEDGAKNLRRLANTRIDRPASALVVITAGEYAYVRDDGVFVVPLGALRP
jgi:predicted AAA+ superfamily ATPase